MEALVQAERMRHQMAAQRPMSRDDKINLWRQQGLSDKEALFLRENPEMIDFPQISSLAANEALAAGIERDSEPYWKVVKHNFEKHMTQLKAQAEAAQKTPEFFQPPPPPAPQTNSTIVCAPVSREAPGSRDREPIPTQVKLSPQELEIAKASGISPSNTREANCSWNAKNERGSASDTGGMHQFKSGACQSGAGQIGERAHRSSWSVPWPSRRSPYARILPFGSGETRGWPGLVSITTMIEDN